MKRGDFQVCYPMRGEWENTPHGRETLRRLRERPPHPAPEVPCRPVASAEEMPGPRLRPNALALAREAAAHGWTGRATYARGTELRANGSAGQVIETVALRMARETQRAVAVWRRDSVGAKAGKWAVDECWWWTPETVPEVINITELRKRVNMDISGNMSSMSSAVVLPGTTAETAVRVTDGLAGICADCSAGRHCYQCTCCKGMH
jgi:hypothetical protein